MPHLLPVLLACAEPTEAEKKPEVSASAIAPGVYAVEGVDEDLPTDDLAPLFDVVGDAQFVGLATGASGAASPFARVAARYATPGP